jgi:hypothetical protein
MVFFSKKKGKKDRNKKTNGRNIEMKRPEKNARTKIDKCRDQNFFGETPVISIVNDFY